MTGKRCDFKMILEKIPPQRTPLHNFYSGNEKGQFEWTDFGGYEIRTRPDEDSGKSRARLARCALVDSSALARVGLCGKNAKATLERHDYEVPVACNEALRQKDGSMVVHLSANEYLLLGSLADEGTRLVRDVNNWADGSLGSYKVPRQDSNAWMTLTGKYASHVMAKVCSVNLNSAKFPVGAVAQTSVADVRAIIVNGGHEGLPALQLLVDSASAFYLWAALLDAMEEFEGAAGSITMLKNWHTS